VTEFLGTGSPESNRSTVSTVECLLQPPINVAIAGDDAVCHPMETANVGFHTANEWWRERDNHLSISQLSMSQQLRDQPNSHRSLDAFHLLLLFIGSFRLSPTLAR
jgi:hypothetical protein